MQHQNAIMMSAQDALPTPLWPSSQLATGLSPLAPRSGLERSDFVLCPISDLPRLGSNSAMVRDAPIRTGKA